jgi:hypothetical protein
MISKKKVALAEMSRFLASAELCGHVAAPDMSEEAEVVGPAASLEDRSLEQLETALFGALLDDIIGLSEFDDLQRVIDPGQQRSPSVRLGARTVGLRSPTHLPHLGNSLTLTTASRTSILGGTRR